MSFRFKTEDFDDRPTIELVTDEEIIANIANAILAKHIATLPEVYAIQPAFPVFWTDVRAQHLDTHRARLWGVEEIAPKKCEHSLKYNYAFMMNVDGDMATINRDCQDCGKRLVAKWEEAE